MQTRSLALCVLISVVCPCAAGAYTMRFDDIPAGGDLAYYRQTYEVSFAGPFCTIDTTAAAWGHPQSPPNVLKWVGGTGDYAEIYVGPPGGYVRSVGAYFSTEPDTVLRMTGYLAPPHHPFPKVTERLIGAPGEAWENVYVELRAEDGSPFDFVAFEAVSSPDARLHFCVDDMTVTPVPESSSLASLSLALLAAGAGVRWRRRRQGQCRGSQIRRKGSGICDPGPSVTDDFMYTVLPSKRLALARRLDALTAPNGGGVFVSLWEAWQGQRYSFYSQAFTSDPGFPSLAVNGGFDHTSSPATSPADERYYFDNLEDRLLYGP